MPDITPATSRAAMIAEEEGIEIIQTSAPTGTLRLITVRGLAIARCTAATIAKDSRTDTKMGIGAIDPKSDWIVRARSRDRAFYNRVNFDCFDERQEP